MRKTSRSARIAGLILHVLLVLPVTARDGLTLPGYTQRLSGEVLRYHAPDPEVTHGLLVRSLDADRPIEWETAPVPCVRGVALSITSTRSSAWAP